MKTFKLIMGFYFLLSFISVYKLQAQVAKAPAYPLITHNPYFSVWSFSDKLNESVTRHWTGATQSMVGYIKVDDKIYRFLGEGDSSFMTEKAVQTALNMNATQTCYQFDCGAVRLKITFTSPLLINDLNILSRPISYISFQTKSNDSKVHTTQIYMGVSSVLSVNNKDQKVNTTLKVVNNLSMLTVGSVEQPVLKKKGDNLRIDWGYAYIATSKMSAKQNVCSLKEALNHFINGASIVNISGPTNETFLNTVFNKQNIGVEEKENLLLMGYDENYSIQYFKENLKPWWTLTQKGGMEQLLEKASNEYENVIQKCLTLNQLIYNDAYEAGGETYAKLCITAYRQSIAAHNLVKSTQNGDLLFLSKENFSNGCINTVDVTYPSAPLFLAYNPSLMKGMLNGIFYFSEKSGLYNKPYAAHDLGTYPIANGQIYGEGMPVEESGNMIILTAAIAKAEGNGLYAKQHWKTLTGWVQFLEKEGLDPANQLCTDDFAGHLARNANLAVKAIMGIKCYAYLANMIGEKAIAQKYDEMASDMVVKWQELSNAGDHFALTYNDKNTWSQKYNMVWDKVFNFSIFPTSVYQKEVTYYISHQNEFGLPLDSRKTYTKSDWVLWTATLANTQADFEKIMNPINKFSNNTPSRVPLSDWHETTNGKQVGFQARSVVGGYFIKVLDNKWDNERPLIPIKGNGYYKSTLKKEVDSDGDEISANKFRSKQDYLNVYFYPQKKGKIHVALKVKSNPKAATANIYLDGKGKPQSVDFLAGVENTIIDLGEYYIPTAGYHYLKIADVQVVENQYPVMEALLIQSETGNEIKYNKSVYQGAASTHLRYTVPGDSTVKWFYTEVKVPKEVENSEHAYYETNGFHSGYGGIQLNSLTERRFIFSIWSLFKTDDPTKIPNDYLVHLNSKGSNVFSGDFGNEGSGGHSHLVYPWKVDQTYRFLSGIKSLKGDSATYIAYYAVPDDQYQWHLMSEWTQHKTDTKTGFKNLYAFVENFGGNGDDYFKAYYGNQWVVTPSGNWIELNEAKFTTTANPLKHQRYDYGAGVEGHWFYMYSGGFKHLKNMNAGDYIKRPLNKVHPNIIFESLPHAL